MIQNTTLASVDFDASVGSGVGHVPIESSISPIYSKSDTH